MHNGHLAITEAARDRLALREVVFVPAGRPWMKAGNHLSPAAHRVRMLELALAGRDGFRLSKLEIERPGPSYTMDTMTELQAALGVRDELYFIIGQDKLEELPQWHEPARLLELCMLVAAPRPRCPTAGPDGSGDPVTGFVTAGHPAGRAADRYQRLDRQGAGPGRAGYHRPCSRTGGRLYPGKKTLYRVSGTRCVT